MSEEQQNQQQDDQQQAQQEQNQTDEQPDDTEAYKKNAGDAEQGTVADQDAEGTAPAKDKE